MAKFKTLVKDIQRVLTDPPEISQEMADELGRTVSRVIQEKMNHDHEPRLRMSNLGSKCLRQLWYKVNRPERAIPFTPDVRLKFMYGDLIEALVLWLAKISGHEVSEEQKELEINGVRGHKDAKIDGLTVDVKSCSSMSFDKFERGLNQLNDDFGYLDQLGSYTYADKDEDGAFVAIDKTLGHIAVDYHKGIGTKKDYGKLVEERKAIVALPDPPPRGYFDEKDGESGNRKLGVGCSYCSFYKECWPGVRTFLYKAGDKTKPRHLTKVVREPNVPEAK